VAKEIVMISVLIGVLIIVVIGTPSVCAIDKFAGDRRLAQLLKLLVVRICIAAILQLVAIKHNAAQAEYDRSAALV
jgi:Mn2+/Fe2+ NRAMP family transporter